jgi:uncharacterized protein YqeY
MSRIDTVRAEMMAALKNKEKERKDALSLLLSALKNKAIDKRADLTQEEEDAIVLKEIRQCQETIDTAPKDRTEIIAEAKARMAVYHEFAPKLMDEAEITTAVQDTLAELNITSPTAKDKSLLMRSLMPKLKGKADSGLVNAVITKLLS